METTLQTLESLFTRDACYWGERGEWLVVIGQNRDSDCLTRSNYDAALELLGGESDTVAVESASHWACGWVERIVVHHEATDKIAIAEEILARLEDYPVLDEELFFQYETEDADDMWRNCYNWRERIEYVRQYRYQCEFHSLSNMVSAIRGDWFPGYASELIA